eukprot:XP_006583959.2 uncharacterized protein LOC100804751 [Glycine max]
MAAAATNLNLWGILLESKRIINAHSRHFLALSVIFLLPLSFSLIVSPFLFPLLSPHHSSHIHILLRQTQPQPLTLTLTETPPPLLPFPFSFPLLFFLLFVVFFSLFALASITHSVFHGFFGRPVKLLPALLSILTSFLPLLATSVLTHLLLLSLSLPTIFLFSTASSPRSSSPSPPSSSLRRSLPPRLIRMRIVAEGLELEVCKCCYLGQIVPKIMESVVADLEGLELIGKLRVNYRNG